jgi:class 3 adenylate cyclase
MKDLIEIFNEHKNNHGDISLEKFTKEDRNDIPENEQDYKLEKNHWLNIKDVTCVYIDIIGSTQLNLSYKLEVLSGVYRLFLIAAIDIFKEFSASYYDIKGDGLFALFGGKHSQIPAICSAITFKTYLNKHLNKLIALETNNHIKEVKITIGLCNSDLLVKRVGKRRNKGGDQDNEIWLGDAVNIASKLVKEKALDSKGNKISSINIPFNFYNYLLSDNIFKKYLIMSCGCPDETPVNLWKEYDREEKDYGIDPIYMLTSEWCLREDKMHGPICLKKVMNHHEKIGG